MKEEKEKSRELQITDHPDRLRREIERYKRLYEHELCLLDAFRLRLAQHHSHTKQSTDAAAIQAEEESPHHDGQQEPADARMPTKMLKPTVLLVFPLPIPQPASMDSHSFSQLNLFIYLFFPFR